MRCTIREATPADAPALVELVRRLTREDNGRDSLLTPTHLAKECFGSTARFSVLLAEQAGRAVGYAAFHRSYDTDHAAKGFYLQDLYVEPDVRRQGIGRTLLAAVARACQADGGCYLFWNALTSNAAARAFYRRIGAREEPVVTLTLQPDALERLARDFS